jgi:hypothetical protein
MPTVDCFFKPPLPFHQLVESYRPWERMLRKRGQGMHHKQLAALNGIILALMDWLHMKNVASQMRHFCAKPHELLRLLLGKLSR